MHYSEFWERNENLYFESCCASSLIYQCYKRSTLIIGKVIDGTVCGEYSERMAGGSLQRICTAWQLKDWTPCWELRTASRQGTLMIPWNRQAVRRERYYGWYKGAGYSASENQTLYTLVLILRLFYLLLAQFLRVWRDSTIRGTWWSGVLSYLWCQRCLKSFWDTGSKELQGWCLLLCFSLIYGALNNYLRCWWR